MNFTGIKAKVQRRNEMKEIEMSAFFRFFFPFFLSRSLDIKLMKIKNDKSFQNVMTLALVCFPTMSLMSNSIVSFA